MFGRRLLERVIEVTEPCTVIDVGVGKGEQAQAFLDAGYTVTGVSLSESPIEHDWYIHIQNRMEECPCEGDIVWCSHTLEHTPNVGQFLRQCRQSTIDWFCIVVPNDRQNLLIDGHLTFWTPAHLMYNLVIAGFDCNKAKWYTEGRDIALMVQRVDRPHVDLNYDHGDLEKLAPYFPFTLIPRITDPWLPDHF